MKSGKDRFINSMRSLITRHDMLTQGDRVIVGVSGGPDSVALLHGLYTLREEFGISLHVAHLNHMLRGEAADEEARYVERLAKKLNLSCTIQAIDVKDYADKRKVSIELAARDVRYDFYRRTAIDIGACRVALGHHSGDQAETVLLRLIRGTGMTGLGGMPVARPLDGDSDITVIRPMLQLTSDEIRSYCKEVELAYYIDASNIDPAYFRNRVRHELIPLLEQDYNPRIVQALSNTADLLRDDEDYISREVYGKLDQVVRSSSSCGVVLNVPALCLQHMAIQRRVIRWAAMRLVGELDDFGSVHVEDVLELARSGQTGSCISLPCGLQARRDYEQIIIESVDGVGFQIQQPFEYGLLIPGKTDIPEACVTIEARVFDIEVKSNLLETVSLAHEDEAYFDMGLIDENITARNRKRGDRLSPLGMKGSKKLKDVFIDKKISRNIREQIPVIIWGKEILWVVGLCVSNFARLTPNTRKVLHLRATRWYLSCDR